MSEKPERPPRQNELSGAADTHIWVWIMEADAYMDALEADLEAMRTANNELRLIRAGEEAHAEYVAELEAAVREVCDFVEADGTPIGEGDPRWLRRLRELCGRVTTEPEAPSENRRE